MNKEDILNQIMGVVGLDSTPYYCVNCKDQVEVIPVKTATQDYRKLFYCKNNKCSKFGIITVVVKKTNK